ncbi:MAG: large subunit ribosomal protein L15 [Microgenomates group bacterium Gr01-1014_93]|nr:MAG: large subunit ribosomal protein L15 [Microgenomates group bacterium Gr01-1014_93]
MAKKRIGRGLGSGKGKTSGRGSKGQKARGKIKASFTGSGLPFYKKLPLKRGLKNKKVVEKFKIINLNQLEIFANKSTVDIDSLIKLKLISEKDLKAVKILGNGEIKKVLTVKLPVSGSAKEKIEKAGGEVLSD